MPPPKFITSNGTRLMRPDEQYVIKSWGKQHKTVSQFYYLWTLWDNWVKNPPAVASREGKLGGFLAATYTKSGYINIQEIFVLDSFRRAGIAKELVDFVLKKGIKQGCSRLRLRTEKESVGYAFWSSFGIQPVGECSKDWWYDLWLGHVTDVKSFQQLARGLHLTPTADKRTLGYYRRAMAPLTSAYQQLLMQ